ncbi:hypothetical protein ABD07_14105 [Nitrosomonas oligotropha]|nr:hypothetical protein [Nitrosomonas oligotropha]
MAVIKHEIILQHRLLCCMTDLVVPPVDWFLFKIAEEAFSQIFQEIIKSWDIGLGAVVDQIKFESNFSVFLVDA